MKFQTAKEIMNPQVITLRDNLSVHEAAAFLVDHEISGAPVADEKGNLVGVVSLTDIAQVASETGEIPQPDFYLRGWEYHLDRDELNQIHVRDEGLSVSDIMTPTVFTIPDDTPIPEIARTMIAGRVHRLFVTEGDEVVGIIATLDLLKVVAEQEG